MDLVSVSKHFPSMDLFLIGIGTGERKDLNFVYPFREAEKIALQKFIQELAKSKSESQLNLF